MKQILFFISFYKNVLWLIFFFSFIVDILYLYLQEL